MQMQNHNTYIVIHALLRTASAATQLQQLRLVGHRTADLFGVESLVWPAYTTLIPSLLCHKGA